MTPDEFAAAEQASKTPTDYIATYKHADYKPKPLRIRYATYKYQDDNTGETIFVSHTEYEAVRARPLAEAHSECS